MLDLLQLLTKSGSCVDCAWSEVWNGNTAAALGPNVNCVCPGNQLWFHRMTLQSDGYDDVPTWIASQCFHYAKGDRVMMGSWWGCDCPGCGQEIDLQVCQSQAGFYLGYRCSDCGPMSRVGGYLPDRETASRVLDVARCTSSLLVVSKVVEQLGGVVSPASMVRVYDYDQGGDA